MEEEEQARDGIKWHREQSWGKRFFNLFIIYYITVKLISLLYLYLH